MLITLRWVMGFLIDPPELGCKAQSFQILNGHMAILHHHTLHLCCCRPTATYSPHGSSITFQHLHHPHKLTFSTPSAQFLAQPQYSRFFPPGPYGPLSGKWKSLFQFHVRNSSKTKFKSKQKQNKPRKMTHRFTAFTVLPTCDISIRHF